MIQEKKDKARLLVDNLEKARQRLSDYEAAREYVNSVYCTGTIIRHKSFGEGIIKENTGKYITVNFSKAGEKQLGTFVSAANGLITADAADYAEKMEKYKDVLKSEYSIHTAVNYAEKELAPYADYLE